MRSDLDWQEMFASAFKWPQQRIRGWKLYEKMMPIDAQLERQRLRLLSRNMKAYQISDDLVWAATKLSAEIDPLILFNAAKEARMPFGCVLFSWNGAARLDAMRKLKMPHESEEFPDTEHPFTVVISPSESTKMCIDMGFSTADRRSLMILPLITLFDAANTVPDRNRRHPLDAFLEEKKMGFMRKTHWLLTTKVALQHPESAHVIEDDPAIVCHISGPVTAAGIQSVKPVVRLLHDEAMEKIMSGTGGNMRWFGALCYLLNQPKIVRYVQASQSDKVVGAKPREVAPAEASMLTTFLPRERVVTNLIRHAMTPRKQTGEHDVIGFWSTSHRYGDPACNDGNHHWPAEHTRRQVCSTCGALRWWKKPGKRGHGPTTRVTRGRRLDWGGQDISNLIPKQEQP